MSLIVPKDSKISGSELIFCLLKDEDTIIENLIDSGVFGILVVFSISQKLSLKLGLRKLNEVNIKDQERPYVRKFIIKLVFLGSGGLRYRSYNQKIEKCALDKSSFNKEINIQKDIFKKSLMTGRVITPQILFDIIYYESVSGKFNNEINIFNILSQKKQKYNSYLKFYNYYNKKLEKFKSYIKPSFFRWSTFEGLGLILMTFNENYIPVSRLEIKNKLKIKKIITKQFYLLKEYGYVHNDTHPGNYLWDPINEYGIIIDFGEAYYHENVKKLETKSYIYNLVGRDILDVNGELVTEEYDEFIKTNINSKEFDEILDNYKLFKN